MLGQLRQPVGVLLGVVQFDLAASLVQGGSGVGADHGDVALAVDDNDGEIASLEDVPVLLDLAALLGLDGVQVGLRD